VSRALCASMVSCMAFTLTLRLPFSVCSIEFSWNMSLKLSTPSSPDSRLPCGGDRRGAGGVSSFFDISYIYFNSSYRLVLHQLDLQAGDLRPQHADLLAGLVLVHHHLVLDVPRSVGVLQRVQRLHEVAVRRADAGDHHRLAARRIIYKCLARQNFSQMYSNYMFNVKTILPSGFFYFIF